MDTPSISNGGPPRPHNGASPASPGKGPPSWQQRLSALRYLPGFLRMVFDTGRGLALRILGLRILRALVPFALLWVAKLIIERVELYHRGDAPADWQRL